jgi:hypothetical protein
MIAGLPASGQAESGAGVNLTTRMGCAGARTIDLSRQGVIDVWRADGNGHMLAIKGNRKESKMPRILIPGCKLGKLALAIKVVTLVGNGAVEYGE